jgi:hypothetical protein
MSGLSISKNTYQIVVLISASFLQNLIVGKKWLKDATFFLKKISLNARRFHKVIKFMLELERVPITNVRKLNHKTPFVY